MANIFTVNADIDNIGNLGNYKFVEGVFTMTDGPGAIATGLDKVVGVFGVTPISATTGGFTVSFSTGQLAINSCASADIFQVCVFGK